MKKILFSFLLFFLVVGLALWLFDHSLQSKLSLAPCAFCDQRVIERQKFYEDDLVLALYDYKPICPGHCVIIPKRHVARLEDLSEEETCAIFHVIQRTQKAVAKAFFKENYFILQKNGASAGQTVAHVHFHFVPRQEEEKSLLAFLWHFCLHPIKKPLSAAEIDVERNKMKENF